MLYFCYECENYFEEPLYIKDTLGLPGGFYQEFPECPYCGGNDWHEVEEDASPPEEEDE